jgi:hypothetical protein
MAKLTRKNQKIFCGTATPNNVIAEFGSLAAGGAAYSDDPDDIQTTAYDGGWGEAVVDNNSPCLQDMNALFYLVTRQLAYVFQEGVSEYNSQTEYTIGSLVNDGSGNLYVSNTNTNTGNGLSSLANFTSLLNRTITATGTQQGAYYVTYNDSLILDHPANLSTVILPAATAANAGRQITVKNVADTHATTTVLPTPIDQAIDGIVDGIFIEQWEAVTFVSTGSAWTITNFYY